MAGSAHTPGTRILIADDHAILRHGLKDILKQALEGVTFGEAGKVDELLSELEKQDWDLVILDITMPGQSGLEAISDVKRLRPGLPILILTMHQEELYGGRAQQAEASGYVQKDHAAEELVSAVKKILAGGQYFRIDLNVGSAARSPFSQILSGRELEVLRMFGLGKTVGNTAAELNLSVATVSTYRARILRKLKMKTTAELISHAVRNEMIVVMLFAVVQTLT